MSQRKELSSYVQAVYSEYLALVNSYAQVDSTISRDKAAELLQRINDINNKVNKRLGAEKIAGQSPDVKSDIKNINSIFIKTFAHVRKTIEGSSHPEAKDINDNEVELTLKGSKSVSPAKQEEIDALFSEAEISLLARLAKKPEASVAPANDKGKEEESEVHKTESSAPQQNGPNKLLSEIIKDHIQSVEQTYKKIDQNSDPESASAALKELHNTKKEVDELVRSVRAGEFKKEKLDADAAGEALLKFHERYTEAGDEITHTASSIPRLSVDEFKHEITKLMKQVESAAGEVNELRQHQNADTLDTSLASINQQLSGCEKQLKSIEKIIQRDKQLRSDSGIEKITDQAWGLITAAYDKYEKLYKIASQQAKQSKQTKTTDEGSSMRPRTPTPTPESTAEILVNEAEDESELSANPASEEDDNSEDSEKDNKKMQTEAPKRKSVEGGDPLPSIPDFADEKSVSPPPPPPHLQQSQQNGVANDADGDEDDLLVPAPRATTPPSPPAAAPAAPAVTAQAVPPPVAAANTTQAASATNFDRELEDAKLRLLLAEYRLTMIQRTYERAKPYLKQLIANEARDPGECFDELYYRNETYKKADELVEGLKKARRGESVDLDALREAYDTAEQQDADSETERRNHTTQIAVKENPGNGDITEKQQREVFAKFREDTYLKNYTKTIENLVQQGNQANKIIFDAKYMIALSAQMDKLSRDLEDYKALLEIVAETANKGVYGSRFSKSTLYGDRDAIRQKIAKISSLLGQLSAANSVVNTRIHDYLESPQNVGQRAHYQAKEVNEEVIVYNASQQDEIDRKANRFLGGTEEYTRSMPDPALGRGARPDTTEVFTMRYIPTHVIIRERGSLFYPEGKVANVVVFEKVEKNARGEPSYHEQTFKARKLSELNSAPESALLDFAMEAVLRGKASVAKGPVIIPNSMQDKLKLAIAKVCEHLGEEYTVDEKIRKKAMRSMGSVKKHFAQNAKNPLGVDELAEKLDPATDNISFRPRHGA